MQAAETAHVNTAVFADGSDIQTFLKKILDQTTKLESVKLDGLQPAAAGDIDAQLQVLKKDLASREEELAKLKAAGSAPAAAASADTEKLSSRIKELETKLAEYEILEDDIADLSLYKEENVRLRTELDKVKVGGPAPAAASAPAPAAPAPQAPASDDIVAEFAEAVKQPMSAGGEIPKIGGDPISEFESAVNLEKKMAEAQPPAAAPPPPVPAAPAPVAAAPPPPPPPAPAPTPFAAKYAPAPAAPAANSEGDDLFAEFENPNPESLDTDKMMEEMAALVSMEPGQGTALQDEIDTDKMAAEATRLTKS